MIIRVTNNLDNSSPNTFMSVAKSAGVGTIDVKNINSFQANWATQIGKTGEERAEIKILGTATPTGTSLIFTANTTYEHPSDTPVYATKFDQIVFARSTSGTSGTAVAIADGTITITPDSEYTQYDDTGGISSYSYKTWFRNSITTDESSQSDWLTPSGFTFFSLGKVRQRIKGKLYNSNYLKNDSQVDDWVNEWLEEMNNAIVKIDKSYSMGTVDVGFGTDGLGTISSTDFKDIKKLWTTYNGSDYYKSTKADLNEIWPNETFNTTHPYHVWQGDSVFEIRPAESGGTAQITYYKRNPILVDDTDEIPFAMRSYTNSFVNYALSEAYYNDDKDSKGDRYLTRATKDKQLFVNEMTPRSYSGVQTIQITHVVSPDGDLENL